MPTAADQLSVGSALPSACRERALELHKDGQLQDCVKVLEESMDGFKQSETLSDVEELAADKHDTMHMLVSAYLMQFFRQADEHSDKQAEETLKVPLTRASNLLEQLSQIEGDDAHSMRMLDIFVSRGFHALTQYKLRHSSTASHELTRANMFFTSALKLDSNDARAIFGKAAVFIHLKEWEKALALLRQIIPRRPRPDIMKEVKFAMAMCFCGMRRFEHMRSALMGVLEVDPNDVETLCALATLDAHEKGEVEMEDGSPLEKAWKVDQENPVVLLRAAHSAFLVGMEMSPDERLKPDGPWSAATGLLQKVLAANASFHVKAEAHFQLGRLKHAQDLFEEAREEYQKCRKISPDHHACLFELAKTCVEMSHYQEAISTLEAIRKTNGGNREVLKLLTFVYLRTHHREAANTARELCAPGVSDNDVEALTMLAEAHEQQYADGDESSVKEANEAYHKVGKLLEAGTGQDQASAQMWNNLGTLRGLEGDSEAASKAYAQAEKLIEEHKAKSGDAEETKDIHVTEITLRFNRAWLADSSDQPDNLQATSDLLKLREEVSWYADSALRLGTKWLDIGDFDRAAKTYGEASKQCPVLSHLMQAHVYRQQGEFYKALQAAESASEQATSKQFHYVHVFLGNLYFEFSQEPQCKHDQENFLSRALWNFIEALKNAKDCHYAANGMGMVFAQRGRLECAKRTFQSVIQHGKSGGLSDEDANVYVNLGHIYVASGGSEAKKAIALYEKARKLRPNDLSIRLYLARAHFQLKEYEKSVGILSDALAFWPDDVALRYNLAVSLEHWGRILVNEEKKVDRVVGIESGLDKMERAVEVLSSAANHFGNIKRRWAGMSHNDKKNIAKDIPEPMKFLEDLKRSDVHQEYCNSVVESGREQLEVLKKKRADLDAKVAEIATQKKREQAEQERLRKDDEEEQAEENRLDEDEALRIMRAADEIKMPQNIGAQPEAKAQAAGRGRTSREVGEHSSQARKELPDGEEGEGKPKAKAKRLSKKEQRRQEKKEKKLRKKLKKQGKQSGSESSFDPDAPPKTRSVPTHSTVDLPSVPSEAGTVELPSGGEPTHEPLVPEDQAKEVVSEGEGDSAMEDDERRREKKERKKAKKEQRRAKREERRGKRKRRKHGGEGEDEAGDDGAQEDAADGADSADAKEGKKRKKRKTKQGKKKKRKHGRDDSDDIEGDLFGPEDAAEAEPATAKEMEELFGSEED